MDGDVKIRVTLDTKGTERGADRVRKRMGALASTIRQTFSKTAKADAIQKDIAAYEEQARAAENTVKTEKKALADLMKAREEAQQQYERTLAFNAEVAPELRHTPDTVGITNLDTQIAAADAKIAEAQKNIDGYKNSIRDAKKEIKDLGDSSNPVAEGFEKLGNRISRLARRVFIFQMFTSAFRAMRVGLMNLLKADSAVSKSMAQIKGSLYAAFMPIYNFILPAIRTLLNFLAKLASAIASIIGGLFGTGDAAKTAADALDNQAGSTGSAGSAAKKATKYLAAFDEVNQMNDESGGGGGGGAGGGTLGMDYSGLAEVSDKMKEIAKWVLAIAAGIALWKITKALGGLKDARVLRNISFIAGAALAIKGAFDFIPAFIDAWKNGISDINGSDMLKGTLGLVIGLFLMFDRVGGAVGLIVMGIGYVVTGIKDWIEQGPGLENILYIFGGIMLALSGIMFFTGHVGWGIALMAAGIAALAGANWDTIKEALKEADERITDMLEDDPELLRLYNGVKDVALAIADAVESIGKFIGKIFDAFDTDAVTVASEVLERLGAALQSVADLVTKITNEGLSMDVVADVANLDFVSTASVATVTGGLIKAIASAIGLGGKIGIGAGGGIVLTLVALADIGMNVGEIIGAENAKDRSDAILKLIMKILFGAIAALVTVVLGGGGFALMISVPIAIRLATAIFGSEASASGSFAEDITKAIEAATTLEELRQLVSSFTGLEISESVFSKLVPLTEEDRIKMAAGDISGLKEQTMAFMGVFQERSGQEGFQEWLQSLGLVSEEADDISTSLSASAQTIETVTGAAGDAGTAVEDMSTQIEGIPEITVDDSSINALGESSETAHLQIDNAVESTGDLVSALDQIDDKAAESVANTGETFDDMARSAQAASQAIIESTDNAWSNMQAGAQEARDGIQNTFSSMATWMESTFKDAWTRVAKVFSKGGAGFKGIQAGVEKSFKRIVNQLIDGLNAIGNKSFGQINEAMDTLRAANVLGIRPFATLPKISIPRIPKLAQGAVIPANNEFLAILGDQNRGTNIEAPLDTIVEAMLMAMNQSGMGGGSIAAAVRSALQGLSFKVGKKAIGYVVADAINENRRAEGKLALDL